MMMMELYLFLLLSYSSYKMMTCLRQARKKTQKNYLSEVVNWEMNIVNVLF